MLAEVDLKWFKGHPARSVTGFEDLETSFVQQYSANKKKEVGLGNLFDVRVRLSRAKVILTG